jgi:ATP-dependent RNA helicase SUPV3L1/SUV3
LVSGKWLRGNPDRASKYGLLSCHPPRRHPAHDGWRAGRIARLRPEGATVADFRRQYFVSAQRHRRTAVLVRDIGARGSDALPVTVAADGEVSVGPEPIGHLAGFDFRVDPSARLADKRLLLAAADRRLGEELDRRAKTLIEAPDQTFELVIEDGRPAVGWQGTVLARLAPGRSLLEPAIRTSRALDQLSAARRAELRARLESWLDAQVDHNLRSLKKIAAAAADRSTSPGVRALSAMLTAAGGVMTRRELVTCIAGLEQTDRQTLHKLGVRLGPLDVFQPALLKPAAQQWRAVLQCVRANQPMPVLPPPGSATLDGEADARGASLAYRRLGRQWLRIDLADRLASHAHKVRSAGGEEEQSSGRAGGRKRAGASA